MSKESISQAYQEATKVKYRDALVHVRDPFLHLTLITGTENPGSIGEAIARDLSGDILVPTRKQMDVTMPDQVHSYMDGRKMDNLVCSHGSTRMGWFEDGNPAGMWDVVEVNLLGSALVAREFVRQTLDLPWRKRIVFIGSMAYNHVLNGSALYCASKAGLAMLTRCLAWELAPKGYDVICFHPSNTEGTPMTEETITNLQRYRNISRREAEQYWGASLPRARWLQPADIARVVRNFLEDPSGYMSGCNVELGGGQR